MATRRPLVVVSGVARELPSGDTLPANTATIASVTGLQTALNTKANITISATAPASPAVNDLWLEVL